MTKFGVSVTSFFALIVSAISLQYPSYYLQTIIDPSISYAVIRGMIVCGLLAYMINPRLRTSVSKQMLSALGIVLIVGAVTTFISPTLFGHLPAYYPIGDAIIFLELGIWAKVLSAELPVRYIERKPLRFPQFALSLLMWANIFRYRLTLQPRGMSTTMSGLKPQAGAN